MRILGLLKDKVIGRRDNAGPSEAAVSVASSSRESKWVPPEGLDPHQRNLATLMMRLRVQTADLTPAEAVRHMGMPFGYESEALVPERGPGREGWSDRKMFEALSRDGDYMTMKGHAGPRVLDAIDSEVVRRLAEDADLPPNLPKRAYALRADVTGRVVDCMESGRRLDERVSIESEMLERQSSSFLADRFRDMPIVSFKPLPDRGEARREWLEDTLRAEHAAAHQGLLSPLAVVRAASHRRGPVHNSWGAAPEIVDCSKQANVEVSVEASRIEKLSEASLRLRFRDVPGVVDASIPDAGRGVERRTWVETALMAQKVRETMSVTGQPRNMAGKDHIALGGEVGQSAHSQIVDHRFGRQVAAQSFAIAAMVGR